MKKLQGEQRTQWFIAGARENRDKKPGQNLSFEFAKIMVENAQKQLVNFLMQIRDLPFKQWYKDELIFNPGLSVTGATALWEHQMRETPDLFVKVDGVPHIIEYQGRLREEGTQNELAVRQQQQTDIHTATGFDQAMNVAATQAEKFRNTFSIKAEDGIAIAVRSDVLNGIKNADDKRMDMTLGDQFKVHVKTTEVEKAEKEKAQQADAVEAQGFVDDFKAKAKMEASCNKEVEDYKTEMMLT